MNHAAKQLPVLAGVFLLGAAATAAGILLIAHSPTDDSGATAGSTYILGPARSLLSAGLYERADLYFHKGVAHHKDEAFHGFFQKWKEAICPVEHVHAGGREINEILPWLRLATKSDPHNIEVYLVASFWLNGECQRTDLALEAIQEAMEKNPNRYELHQEMGRLYLISGQLPPALDSLETARDMIHKYEQADPEQAKIDLAFIHMARSYLNEALGKKTEAIEATKDFLQVKPSQHFADRLEKLEDGILDPTAAKVRLEQLFIKTHECEQDDHDHHDEHDC